MKIYFDISNLIHNQVELWKLRAYNPHRKSSRIGNLSVKQVDALIYIISIMSEKLYPKIRQLLSSKESITLNNARWLDLMTNFNL